jgi:hypothetical protein
MRTQHHLLALVLVLASAVACAQPAPPIGAPLVPLFMSHHESSTHHVYTILESDYILTQTHYGFSPGGVVAYIEPHETHNTRAFDRFWSPDRTDTFLTDDPFEKQYVLSHGWQFVRNEGYIYTFQVPGSSPLYRINKTNHATGDHDHYYTTSYYDMWMRVIYMGWEFDRIAGYVYATGDVNRVMSWLEGSPASPRLYGGFVKGYRQQNPMCNPGCHPRTKAFGEYFDAGGNRGNGATTQVVSFDLTAYGLWSSGDHLGVMARAAVDYSGQNLGAVPPNHLGYYYVGAGVLIGDYGTDNEETGSRNCKWRFEVFYPVKVFEDAQSACGEPLSDGVKYRMTLRVSDNRSMSFTVRDGFGNILQSATQVIPSDVYGFYPELSGMLFTAQHVSSVDYTAYIENLSVTWQ